MYDSQVACGDGYSVVGFEKLSKLVAGTRSKQNWDDGLLIAVLSESEGFGMSVKCVVTLFGFVEDLFSGSVL